MTDVVLFIYDLSNGIFSRYSKYLFGIHMVALWHTSIVVYEKEWWFGRESIVSNIPVIFLIF